MSSIDLPPGIGLVGTPLGTFRAPPRTRRLATAAVALVIVFGAVTLAFVAQHPERWYYASTKVVLQFAFAACTVLGYAVRHARVAVTRDGVRWGWGALGFTQDASRIVAAHVYGDGVAFEAKRGSWWFIAARDWERFDAFVRHLRRAELPVRDHTGKAPLRARLQSYGRFLDGLLVGSVAASFAVMLWAS